MIEMGSLKGTLTMTKGRLIQRGEGWFERIGGVFSPNSHQLTRLREKKMRRFQSAKQAQRFLSAFGPLSQHFQPERHRLRAEDYRATLQSRFQQWNEIARVKRASS